MSTIKELMDLGRELDLTGNDLRSFVKEEQDRERDRRLAERQSEKDRLEAERQSEKDSLRLRRLGLKLRCRVRRLGLKQVG